jgi:hypothetical protein
MKLKAKQRNALPAKDFAGPNRSFPIPDRNHARAALAEIGHAPPSARPRIHAMAEKKLKGIVPRGEHHQAHHRAPVNHKEFHRLGNDVSGSAQGSSQDNANMQGAQGIATG